MLYINCLERISCTSSNHFEWKLFLAKLVLTSPSVCSMKNRYLSTARGTSRRFRKSSQTEKVWTLTHVPEDVLTWREAKDGAKEEQIGFDFSEGIGEWRGYTLSHTMSQPLMGQRSDALISLIDGLEAYNSPQREDDQENSGEGEQLGWAEGARAWTWPERLIE